MIVRNMSVLERPSIVNHPYFLIIPSSTCPIIAVDLSDTVPGHNYLPSPGVG